MTTKYDFSVACGFMPQSGAGVFNTDLAARTGADSWAGDIEGTDHGLLLGDPESGIGESGLTLTMGRRSTDAQVITPSRTRPISLFEAAEVTSLQYAFKFAAGGMVAAATPVDSDFVILNAIDAILQGFGMAGSGTGVVGQRYIYTNSDPTYVSTLIYVNGNEIRLLDCLPTSLAITFAAGKIPVGVVDFAVGSVSLPSSEVPAEVPEPTTIDYGSQLTVVPQIVESVAFGWGGTRGFETLTLTLTQDVEKSPDSNLPDGFLTEATGRATKVSATLYGDTDGANLEAYEPGQLLADAQGELDELKFKVGTTVASAIPTEALEVTIPDPVLDSLSPSLIAARAAWDVEMTATAAAANGELFLDFI